MRPDLVSSLGDGLFAIKSGVDYKMKNGYKVYDGTTLKTEGNGDEMSMIVDLLLGGGVALTAGATALSSVLSLTF